MLALNRSLVLPHLCRLSRCGRWPTRRRRPIGQIVRRYAVRIRRGFTKKIPCALFLKAHEARVQRRAISRSRPPCIRDHRRQHDRNCDEQEEVENFPFHLLNPKRHHFRLAQTYQKRPRMARRFDRIRPGTALHPSIPCIITDRRIHAACSRFPWPIVSIAKFLHPIRLGSFETWRHCTLSILARQPVSIFVRCPYILEIGSPLL